MKKKKWKVVYTEGFKKDMKRLFDWRYAPLRLWNKILYTPNTLKHYWQRITKGYSYQDVWSLDAHIAYVIVNGLKDLKKIKGCPIMVYPKGYFEWERKGKKVNQKRQEKWRMQAEKKWDEVLDDIIGGYQAWLDDNWMTKKETKLKFRKAQKLFSQYFGAFWW